MTYVEPVITDVLNADSTIQGVDKTPTNMEGPDFTDNPAYRADE
jgi:hypothetical protein